MRKLFSSLLLIFIGSVLTAVPHEKQFALFDISGGYRWDDLKWSSSFSLNSPENDCACSDPDNLRVVSKLSWDDLTMYHTLGSIRYVNPDRIYFRLVGDYGRIWNGHHKDRDFLKDNCNSVEFLSSRADAHEGEAFDITGGIGYFFRFQSDRIAMAPIAGYSHHEQHLRMSHLNIVVDTINFATGPVPGLHSNYRTKWYGPWVGMDFFFKMDCNFELYGRGEFHWARFRGSGHWNLRTDFIDDFKQSSRGYGQVYYVGINYDWTCFWKLGIAYSFQAWHTKDGTLHQEFEAGTASASLHPVHWRSQTVTANLQYRY